MSNVNTMSEAEIARRIAALQRELHEREQTRTCMPTTQDQQSVEEISPSPESHQTIRKNATPITVAATAPSPEASLSLPASKGKSVTSSLSAQEANSVEPEPAEPAYFNNTRRDYTQESSDNTVKPVLSANKPLWSQVASKNIPIDQKRFNLPSSAIKFLREAKDMLDHTLYSLIALEDTLEGSHVEFYNGKPERIAISMDKDIATHLLRIYTEVSKVWSVLDDILWTMDKKSPTKLETIALTITRTIYKVMTRLIDQTSRYCMEYGVESETDTLFGPKEVFANALVTVRGHIYAYETKYGLAWEEVLGDVVHVEVGKEDDGGNVCKGKCNEEICHTEKWDQCYLRSIGVYKSDGKHEEIVRKAKEFQNPFTEAGIHEFHRRAFAEALSITKIAYHVITLPGAEHLKFCDLFDPKRPLSRWFKHEEAHGENVMNFVKRMIFHKDAVKSYFEQTALDCNTGALSMIDIAVLDIAVRSHVLVKDYEIHLTRLLGSFNSDYPNEDRETLIDGAIKLRGLSMGFTALEQKWHPKVKLISASEYRSYAERFNLVCKTLDLSRLGRDSKHMLPSGVCRAACTPDKCTFAAKNNFTCFLQQINFPRDPTMRNEGRDGSIVDVYCEDLNIGYESIIHSSNTSPGEKNGAIDVDSPVGADNTSNKDGICSRDAKENRREDIESPRTQSRQRSVSSNLGGRSSSRRSSTSARTTSEASMSRRSRKSSRSTTRRLSGFGPEQANSNRLIFAKVSEEMPLTAAKGFNDQPIIPNTKGSDSDSISRNDVKAASKHTFLDDHFIKPVREAVVAIGSDIKLANQIIQKESLPSFIFPSIFDASSMTSVLYRQSEEDESPKLLTEHLFSILEALEALAETVMNYISNLERELNCERQKGNDYSIVDMILLQSGKNIAVLYQIIQTRLDDIVISNSLGHLGDFSKVSSKLQADKTMIKINDMIRLLGTATFRCSKDVYIEYQMFIETRDIRFISQDAGQNDGGMVCTSNSSIKCSSIDCAGNSERCTLWKTGLLNEATRVAVDELDGFTEIEIASQVDCTHNMGKTSGLDDYALSRSCFGEAKLAPENGESLNFASDVRDDYQWSDDDSISGYLPATSPRSTQHITPPEEPKNGLILTPDTKPQGDASSSLTWNQVTDPQNSTALYHDMENATHKKEHLQWKATLDTRSCDTQVKHQSPSADGDDEDSMVEEDISFASNLSLVVESELDGQSTQSSAKEGWFSWFRNPLSVVKEGKVCIEHSSTENQAPAANTREESRNQTNLEAKRGRETEIHCSPPRDALQEFYGISSSNPYIASAQAKLHEVEQVHSISVDTNHTNTVEIKRNIIKNSPIEEIANPADFTPIKYLSSAGELSIAPESNRVDIAQEEITSPKTLAQTTANTTDNEIRGRTRTGRYRGKTSSGEMHGAGEIKSGEDEKKQYFATVNISENSVVEGSSISPRDVEWEEVKREQRAKGYQSFRTHAADESPFFPLSSAPHPNRDTKESLKNSNLQSPPSATEKDIFTRSEIGFENSAIDDDPREKFAKVLKSLETKDLLKILEQNVPQPPSPSGVPETSCDAGMNLEFAKYLKSVNPESAVDVLLQLASKSTDRFEKISRPGDRNEVENLYSHRPSDHSNGWDMSESPLCEREECISTGWTPPSTPIEEDGAENVQKNSKSIDDLFADLKFNTRESGLKGNSQSRRQSVEKLIKNLGTAERKLSIDAERTVANRKSSDILSGDLEHLFSTEQRRSEETLSHLQSPEKLLNPPYNVKEINKSLKNGEKGVRVVNTGIMQEIPKDSAPVVPEYEVRVRYPSSDVCKLLDSSSSTDKRLLTDLYPHNSLELLSTDTGCDKISDSTTSDKKVQSQTSANNQFEEQMEHSEEESHSPGLQGKTNVLFNKFSISEDGNESITAIDDLREQVNNATSLPGETSPLPGFNFLPLIPYELPKFVSTRSSTTPNRDQELSTITKEREMEETSGKDLLQFDDKARTPGAIQEKQGMTTITDSYSSVNPSDSENQKNGVDEYSSAHKASGRVEVLSGAYLKNVNATLTLGPKPFDSETTSSRNSPIKKNSEDSEIDFTMSGSLRQTSIESAPLQRGSILPPLPPSTQEAHPNLDAIDEISERQSLEGSGIERSTEVHAGFSIISPVAMLSITKNVDGQPSSTSVQTLDLQIEENLPQLKQNETSTSWADYEISEGEESNSKPITPEVSNKKRRLQNILPAFSDQVQIDPIMGRKKKQKKQKKKAVVKSAAPAKHNEKLVDEFPARSLGDVAVWKEKKPSKGEAQVLEEGSLYEVLGDRAHVQGTPETFTGLDEKGSIKHSSISSTDTKFFTNKKIDKGNTPVNDKDTSGNTQLPECEEKIPETVFGENLYYSKELAQPAKSKDSLLPLPKRGLNPIDQNPLARQSAEQESKGQLEDNSQHRQPQRLSTITYTRFYPEQTLNKPSRDGGTWDAGRVRQALDAHHELWKATEDSIKSQREITGIGPLKLSGSKMRARRRQFQAIVGHRVSDTDAERNGAGPGHQAVQSTTGPSAIENSKLLFRMDIDPEREYIKRPRAIHFGSILAVLDGQQVETREVANEVYMHENAYENCALTAPSPEQNRWKSTENEPMEFSNSQQNDSTIYHYGNYGANAGIPYGYFPSQPQGYYEYPTSAEVMQSPSQPWPNYYNQPHGVQQPREWQDYQESTYEQPKLSAPTQKLPPAKIHYTIFKPSSCYPPEHPFFGDKRIIPYEERPRIGDHFKNSLFLNSAKHQDSRWDTLGLTSQFNTSCTVENGNTGSNSFQETLSEVEAETKSRKQEHNEMPTLYQGSELSATGQMPDTGADSLSHEIDGDCPTTTYFQHEVTASAAEGSPKPVDTKFPEGNSAMSMQIPDQSVSSQQDANDSLSHTDGGAKPHPSVQPKKDTFPQLLPRTKTLAELREEFKSKKN